MRNRVFIFCFSGCVFKGVFLCVFMDVKQNSAILLSF